MKLYSYIQEKDINSFDNFMRRYCNSQEPIEADYFPHDATCKMTILPTLPLVRLQGRQVDKGHP
jgi:hypothetical protein